MRPRLGQPALPQRMRSSPAGSVSPFITRPTREPTKRVCALDGLQIERQCVLEQANRLCVRIARIRLEPCGAPPENIVECRGMFGRPGGFRGDQLDAEARSRSGL